MQAKPGGGIRRIAWLPGNERVVVGLYPGRMVLWNLKAGKRDAVYAGHDKMVTYVGIKPDGTAIVSAAADGLVKFWPVPPAE